MRRLITIAGITLAAIAAVTALKWMPATSSLIWSISDGGSWLLPLVIVGAILDSVHPCSFSILLITIAFLFALQLSRRQILAIGGTYILGIFTSYFVIGLGLLQVLHLFNTPHFMGKLGAALLIGFGVLNLVNRFFPSFPLKLKIPSVSHTAMGKLMEKASLPAAFALGALVGICQFPCMGGPYLMVIGLLRDQVTYFAGFGYLLLYNALLVLPLVTVHYITADAALLEKMKAWKSSNIGAVRLYAGIAMILIGIIVLYV